MSTTINIKATQLGNCWYQANNNLTYIRHASIRDNYRNGLKTYVSR